jgi:hypothetical protein
MALTRLQNIISSVEGRIIYVNPDDFDSTDAIDNKGNSPLRPFKTIARAVLEVARYSYVSAGNADDKFDQFTIMLYPGDHIVDNRPGSYAYAIDGNSNYVGALAAVPFSAGPVSGQYGWSDTTKQYSNLYQITNSIRGGLIIPRGVSLVGMDLRKTKIRPKFVPVEGLNDVDGTTQISFTATNTNPNELTITGVSNGPDGVNNINDVIIGSIFKKGVAGYSIINTFTAGAGTEYDPVTGELIINIGSGHGLTTDNSIRIADNSLAFTCLSDGGNSVVTYPRPSDPAYDTTINIQSVTTATITVNVGTSSETSDHTFVPGSSGSGNITAVDTGLKIEEGTVITDISTQTGSNTIDVRISKPHNYLATDVSNNTNVGSDIVINLPYEDDNSRTALFRITGGCYFWQFSIFDGDPQGVYREATVEPKNTWTLTDDVQYSHTKLTVFEYASLHDLKTFYRKVSDVISVISSEKIEAKIQENRIVGALADEVSVTKVTRNNNIVTITLSQELEITAGNFVAVKGVISADSDTNAYYIGQRQVTTVNSGSEFTYILSSSSVNDLDTREATTPGDSDLTTNGMQVLYSSPSAAVQVEIDTVESASPYIFNVSLRSTYGICGMHADGSRATGFRSMVVAQYTGISLQKDDSAFLKYNGTIFATQSGNDSLHTDAEAIYNPKQRSYHVKASNRAVIQAVSVFAVGYADHFIAEDGGDMSITNSNSNFGMNSMRSIGFSDQAFKKDALGKITHIIPPRNVESTLSNSYYESIDSLKTQAYGAANSPSRIYLSGRDNFLEITSGGSNFTSTSVTVQDPSGNNKTIDLVAPNGVVTGASFASNNYGTFQPGDEVSIPSPGIGLDCVLKIGDGLMRKVGKFTVGSRVLDKDGSTIKDNIYVPLYETSSATATSERYAEITPLLGNVFDYDSTNPQTNTAGGWYINVDNSTNQIYTAINGNTKYGLNKIEVTPTSYIKRIVDERVDDDKIYRLRYVTQSVTGSPTDPSPSFPQRGYVLQVKRGQDILGRGDRFTDGANLLLLNKYFLAHEAVARWINDNVGNSELNLASERLSCIDDLVNIIEAVAYNLRYGGNDQVVSAANNYITGTGAGANGIQGERDETVDILDNYLKQLMTYVINNSVTSSPVNTPSIGSIENNNTSGNNSNNYGLPNVINPQTISGEEQLINVFGGCTNVRDAAFTLVDIIVQALGSDSTPGNLNGITSTTPAEDDIKYNRISGHDYNDVYYVYEVEEVTPFKKATTSIPEVPGVYYLTVLKGSIPVSTNVLPGNTFKLSQNIDNIYPEIDINNIVNDPIISDSIADPITIGVVNTTTGLDNNDQSLDNSFSITKESLSYFFDEYLNNELEWDWSDKLGVSSSVDHSYIVNGNSEAHDLISTNIQSGIGNGEVRKIPINPRRPTDTLEVELRRPSTIRSGNHTFEYVGFGPGNYSTGFPIKQNKVLTNDEVKYSQSLKEQGGIAFYSGLNSQGDLYIGNTVINAVTGKTTSNEISELNSLTLKDNLTVIGGSGNTITSTFQGPVTFLKNTTFDSEDNFFSAIKIRNPDGIVTKIINRDSVGALTSNIVVGDTVLTTNPVNGGNRGWVYTEDNEWRQQGIIGVEKIHSYKDGSDYTLNIGSDIDIANVNTNYDLDVTTNQRIGTNLDIGVGLTGSQPGISATKQSRLHIAQDWSDSSVEYRPLEIAVAATPGGAIASRIIDAKVGTDSVFSVDKVGNVSIPDGATYGLSKKAFSTTILIKSVANTTNNQDTITTLGAGAQLTIDVAVYQGSAQVSGSGGVITRSFGHRMTNQLGDFVYYGASDTTPHVSGSVRDADIGGISNLADFNTRSMVVYVNGVIQQPYFDYHFDGTYLYFNGSIAVDGRIDIRCLAN